MSRAYASGAGADATGRPDSWRLFRGMRGKVATDKSPAVAQALPAVSHALSAVARPLPGPGEPGWGPGPGSWASGD